MEIWQITAVGIIGVIISMTLKSMNTEIALFVGITTGIIIFLGIAGKFKAVLNLIVGISEEVSLSSLYMQIILKSLGIAYIAEFGMQLCKDAGENTIASKIEMAGKVLIMAISAPVITGIMRTVTDILP